MKVVLLEQDVFVFLLGMLIMPALYQLCYVTGNVLK